MMLMLDGVMLCVVLGLRWIDYISAWMYSRDLGSWFAMLGDMMMKDQQGR
jgi:hypothetical protein